jgi:heme exporter protein CcmD
MTWSNVADFASMSGHGLYVWGSFVMVVAGFFWELLMLAQRRKRALEDLRDESRLGESSP